MKHQPFNLNKGKESITMRKLIFYLFVAMIITSGVFAVANIQFRVNKVVNIRNGPGLKYDVIETTTPPMQWKVYGLHGDWVKIGENKYVYQSLGNYTMKKLIRPKTKIKKIRIIPPPPEIKLDHEYKPINETTVSVVKPEPTVVTKVIIEREPTLLNNTFQIALLVAVIVLSILFIIFEIIGYRNRPTKIIYRNSNGSSPSNRGKFSENSLNLLRGR